VSFGDVVQFSHPLVRSAAYYSAPPSERRRIHRELAREMDSPQDEDRVVWHLAMAATGPDEDVASRLEQAARRMRARGGYAATTALLQRAADLSVDERLRAGRLLAASEAALTAARPDQARAMLAEARRGLTDKRQAALALRLSGEALFAVGATDDAAQELLAAAKVLMAVDLPLARQTLLRALIAAQFGTTAVFEEVRSFATTVAEADLSPGDRPSAVDLFLFGFLHRFAGDAELAARLLRQALSDLEHSERRRPGLRTTGSRWRRSVTPRRRRTGAWPHACCRTTGSNLISAGKPPPHASSSPHSRPASPRSMRSSPLWWRPAN
jgi:tetratricopeptide (TPR) repeat protein